MEQIKKAIEQLKKAVEDHKPTNDEQRTFYQIKQLTAILTNLGERESRVKPGGPEQAAKLNKKIKAEPIKQETKKKRGRPKKKENVLAQTSDKKKLTDKLNQDAKK